MPLFRRAVSVVLTVRNDPAGCRAVLSSLARQTRHADEIIVVDGGSTDDTPNVIRKARRTNPRIRMITAPGVNIARGRNIGIESAGSEIIATTDSGCRAEPNWLERLTAPFEDDPAVEFVAGFYRMDSSSLLEEVVGLATMPGQLDPVRPETFNPSARSVAYTKDVWSRAGGLPEWLGFSEDTLFDHRVRRINANWRFAADAIVCWRPRGTLKAIAKQFYNYGTGRGHTQIGKADFAYNIRNVLLMLLVLGAILVTPWAAVVVVALFAYFYVWTFHRKAARVARETRRRSAYTLCLLVMWIVLFSNLVGYLVGSVARRKDRDRYQKRMEEYLAA